MKMMLAPDLGSDATACLNRYAADMDRYAADMDRYAADMDRYAADMDRYAVAITANNLNNTKIS